MGWLQDVIHAGGTGGLNWHLHARQSLSQWQPTRRVIELFLMGQDPGSPHLVLIGGSAGWMMPHAWLARFETIDAYDIDPLAPWLMSWRHGRALRQQGVQLQHHRMDALENLPALLERHPNACFWFDNVLGQHRYRVRDEVRVDKDLSSLQHVLQGRNWGSLHDVLSGPTDGRTPPVWQHTASATEGLQERFRQSLLREVGAQQTWQDHQTGQVLPGTTSTVWTPWAFRPQHWHWLQMGWVSA